MHRDFSVSSFYNSSLEEWPDEIINIHPAPLTLASTWSIDSLHPYNFEGENKSHPSDPLIWPTAERVWANTDQPHVPKGIKSLNTNSNFGGSTSAVYLQQQRLVDEAVEEAVPSRNTSLEVIRFVKWLNSLLYHRLMRFSTALEYTLMLGWEGREKRKCINNALRHPYWLSGCWLPICICSKL